VSLSEIAPSFYFAAANIGGVSFLMNGGVLPVATAWSDFKFRIDLSRFKRSGISEPNIISKWGLTRMLL